MPTVTKLGKMVTYLEELLFIQLAVLFGSRDRLTTLYRHYQNAHSYQTWQGGDLSWGALITKSCGAFITWYFEITWPTKPSIFPLKQCLSIANLVGSWITARGSHSYSHMNLDDGITWQFENSLSPLNLAGCWRRGEGPACKCLSWHWHLACLWFWLPTKHSPFLFHPAGIKRIFLLFVNNLNFNHLFIEFIEFE